VRTCLAVTTALVVLVVAPAGALAQTHESGRFHGETSRGGHVVEAFSDEEGQVTRVSVEWTARCREFRVPAELITTLAPLSSTTDTREFAAVEAENADSDDVSLRSDAQAWIEMAVTGRRHRPRGRPGAESWSGIIEATIEIRSNKGSRRLLERCGMRRTRWKAWREGFGTGRWTMTSDSADWIGAGQTLAFDRTNSQMAAWGDRSRIDVGVTREGRTWRAEFVASEGTRLRAGVRYASTDPEIPPADLAGFEVSAPHRGCSETTGEFTITSARFDRRGRLRAVAITFVQYCDGSTAALRGALSWRSSP
jgi:hypothetical protein